MVPNGSASCCRRPSRALLIIDEVGFQSLDRQEASLLFSLVSARYEKGSILITTNKAIKDWPEVLAGDEIMATALLDRLLRRCHVLSIKSRSYRLRDLERLIQDGEPSAPKTRRQINSEQQTGVARVCPLTA